MDKSPDPLLAIGHSGLAHFAFSQSKKESIALTAWCVSSKEILTDSVHVKLKRKQVDKEIKREEHVRLNPPCIIE